MEMLANFWRWLFGSRPTKTIVKLSDIPTWSDLFSDNRQELEEVVSGEAGESYDVDIELNSKVSIYEGDITCLEVDGIVRSTNASLDSTDGISGVIGRAAGSNLTKEIKTLRCGRGKAVTTAGYLLPAKYIIHTVGPTRNDNPDLLQSCYRECLQQMKEKQMKSLAFCCISAGNAGYDNAAAAIVALRTVRKWLEEQKSKGKLQEIDRIVFCLYSEYDTLLYSQWMQFYFQCPPAQEETPSAVSVPVASSGPELSASLTFGPVERILEPLPEFIELTYEPCMVSLDDDPSTLRAKMPCGHVISPQSMTDHCRNVISRGRYRFECPAPNCKTQWEYFLVRHVACLTANEMHTVEKKLAEIFLNKERGIQRCPGCQTLCFRSPGTGVCVRCPICTSSRGRKFDFCWECLNEWRNLLSRSSCGNSGCDGKDKRLDTLAKCGTKTINYCKECPMIRGCPSCGILIEHTAKCAHMECPNCPGYGFCFICLKEKKDGKWQCHPYFRPYSCVLAPRQTRLPGTQ